MYICIHVVQACVHVCPFHFISHVSCKQPLWFYLQSSMMGSVQPFSCQHSMDYREYFVTWKQEEVGNNESNQLQTICYNKSFSDLRKHRKGDVKTMMRMLVVVVAATSSSFSLPQQQSYVCMYVIFYSLMFGISHFTFLVCLDVFLKNYVRPSGSDGFMHVAVKFPREFSILFSILVTVSHLTLSFTE